MDAVEEVKSRLSIEDVVSEYVQLKRAGRNFKGLSPFSNEKTPSFIVSPEKQIWHDFSSGKGGNIFSFVMEMEGLEFRGALELLARKAGVDLSQYQSGQSGETGKLKERLHQAVEIAAKFYQVQFSKNQTALEYIFKKRKFTKEVALAFRIGYSPNTGHALLDYLKKQGFKEDELQKAGLVTRRYRGPSDMFRGRIMIPLMDPQGLVIGFTARLLEDDPNAPKYINTPQSLLYDKSRHVFGLHLAKEAIRSKNYAVVTEGNLDVIASHQARVKQVVATAGTAMTEMHLKLLGRFTGDIRLAFDQDAAGLNATERTIPIASKVGSSLSIITIPAGKDPDELIKKDPDAWEQVIEKHQYALDWLIERNAAQLDLKSATGKRQFSDILLRVVKQLTDQVEQDHYIQRLAQMTGVSADAMRSKLSTESQSTRPLKRTNIGPQQTSQEVLEYHKMQDHLLALTLHRPGLRTFLKPVEPDMLPAEAAQELLKFLKANPDFDVSASKQPATLRKQSEYVKIIGLQYETLYQNLEELELRYEAARMQVRLIEQYVKMKKTVIAHELREADETQEKSLLAKARALDKLLKSKDISP